MGSCVGKGYLEISIIPEKVVDIFKRSTRFADDMTPLLIFI